MIWNNIFKVLCTLCEKLNELISSIGNMPQIEGLALVPWCDAEGAIVGFSAVVIDEETSLPTTYYFDAAMQPVAEAPAGEPCPVVPDEPCFPLQGCNADGAYVTKFVQKDGTVVGEIVMDDLFTDCPCVE